MDQLRDILNLFVLSAVVACLTWTFIREQLNVWLRNYALRVVYDERRHWLMRKAFYPLTCPYCLSHWIAAPLVWLTEFQLVSAGFLGWFIAWLAVVWVANVYMLLFLKLVD